MHLVYLGLRHGREKAVMDGIALMDRIRDLTLRLLADPGKYQNRNFMARFADTLRAGATHGGERHIQEMKNAAAAVAIGDEFDRLSLKCPHYHPDGISHDLKDAARGMHEQSFRFRRDGLYAELCYTFANRSEQDAKKALKESREYSKYLNRLHGKAADAARDKGLWQEYKRARDHEPEKELKNWQDQQIDKLCRMKTPESLLGRMIWKRDLSNFLKQPDDRRTGLSLTLGVRENAFLLPLLRKENTMLTALRTEPGNSP